MQNIPSQESYNIQAAEIEELLLQLIEKDRLLFAIFAYHGLSYKEIAETLQLSIASVKVNIHRLRKKIQLELNKKSPIKERGTDMDTLNSAKRLITLRS